MENIVVLKHPCFVDEEDTLLEFSTFLLKQIDSKYII